MGDAKRVLVVGAGYAGTMCANRLVRRGARGPGKLEVVLVDPRDHFVERVRLHQEAASGPIRRVSLRERLPGVTLRRGFVRSIDFDARRARIEDGGESHDEAFDALVLATGSGAGDPGIPGLAAHAASCATAEDTIALRARLAGSGSRSASRGARRRVAIIGGGLTGVELAAELGEQRRDLDVTLVARDVLPAFSPSLREATRTTLTHLGVTLVNGRAAAIAADGVILEDGGVVSSDVTVWAGGFAPSPLARDLGLATEADGAAKVDGALRSVSHPFVHVVGDAARVHVPGHPIPLRMACATATPMGAYAADAIVAEAAGRAIEPFAFAYAACCVSLGRGAGVIQRVSATDVAAGAFGTGRFGAFVKEMICRYAAYGSAMERVGIPYVWPKGPASLRLAYRSPPPKPSQVQT